ncbi:hypothetical protein FRC06_002428 [Ceratobasidium sp. 370]|nr:hypothetical protein FRC06_002428 [Ceratobasidium sp. 370]
MSLQEFACRCLNISVRSAPLPSAPPPVSDSTRAAHYERVYVGDTGIHVSHSQLTLRRRTAPEDSVQWTTISCLLCSTTVYRVASEVAPDFELKDGLVAPGEEFAEAEILRGRDGYIEVNVGLNGCLDAKQTSAARENGLLYSRAFDLVLPSAPKPAALPATPQRPSSPTPASTPRPHLPTLPPLFHPPPYSPSHPVFAYLSKAASVTSNQFRTQAEQAIQAFVDSQVAEVLDKERHLRGEVEVIWGCWRDNWRQQVGPDSVSSPETAHASATVSVREFSPTAASGSGSPAAQTQGSHVSLPVRRPSMPPTHGGPSMLSQSLRQSNFVAPPPSSTPPPQHDGQRDAAMRNTMDDSFAVSASFQIRAGDEMRARESAREAEHRRLKRLSQQGKSGAPPTVPEEEQSGDEETRVRPRNGIAEGKRKVTFQADVKEEDGASEPVPRKNDGDGDYSDVEGAGTPVLFDLDEDEGNQPSTVVEDEAGTSGQPVTPRAKAKARAKSKTAKQPPPIGRKAPVPALLTVDLSSTPAPSKAKVPPKSPQQTTKVRQVRPGEEKLLELLAANLPSHRDAWKPNGKAWEFFDARRKFGNSPDTVSLTSEESNGAKWDNPSKFATSLPVRIAAGPLAMDTTDEREPKTSLHNEPGALVPPLRLHAQTPRQSRERTYAMRDLARSVDPGPVLELQAAEDAAEDTDEDETEGEDALGEMSSAERVRRRTMRIVQRQSGVPDAGMWRSVAS